MNDELRSFLGRHNEQYKGAKEAASTEAASTSNYEEISDGNYVAQIVGMGWRDYQNPDSGGWSGMGPALRLRIVSAHAGKESRFRGWKEDVTFFLFSLHPDKGISEAQLNEKKLAFFTKQMTRLGLSVPDSLGDLPDWADGVGLTVAISIKTNKEGDRQYRNVYLNGVSPYVPDQNFDLETFENQQWVRSQRPLPVGDHGAQPRMGAGNVQPHPKEDEIPF